MSLLDAAIRRRQDEQVADLPKGPEKRQRRRKPPPQAHPKPDRAARRKSEREERHERILKRAELRTDVLVRAQFRCENPDCHADLRRVGCEMDHWHGASRRDSHESIETCWLLCSQCHRNRHASVPSAIVWNERFEEHCAKHGYPFEPHRTRFDALASIAEEL